MSIYPGGKRGWEEEEQQGGSGADGVGGGAAAVDDGGREQRQQQQQQQQQQRRNGSVEAVAGGGNNGGSCGDNAVARAGRSYAAPDREWQGGREGRRAGCMAFVATVMCTCDDFW